MGTRLLLLLALGSLACTGDLEAVDAGADASPAVDASDLDDAAPPSLDAASDGGADGGTDACTPTSCEAEAQTCGTLDDGCGALLSCGEPCPIELDMDFDQGSLDVDASSIDGDVVQLVGRDVGNAGRWKWIYFRARHVRDRALAFVISDDFASGSSRLTDHAMVYSYDQRTWSFFDDNALDTTAGELAFSNDGAFTEDEVFVAYGLPYPQADAEALVATALVSPHVTPTASGDASLVIGQTAGGVDDLGRDVGPNELYGFVITDGATSGPKEKIVLVGGTHSNETTGSIALDALVRWLLTDDPDAVALRRVAEIYVYPMVNPDGRWAGYNRSTVQAPGEDPNRQWTSSEWANNQEVRVVAEATVADTGGGVRYFLDFHSTVGTGAHYAYLDIDGNFTGLDMRDDPFWIALNGRDSMGARDGSYVGRTAMRWGVTALDATFSATMEWYFRPDENVDRYMAMGVAIGRSLSDAIVE